MDYILYILIFCIGTLFGSFFTLAVYRIPIRQDITHTRSFCPKCNHKLNFFDMIPIFSYIFLGGKCRYCKEKIRPRYLILEILSGCVFVLYALSIKLSLYSINYQSFVYFIFGTLYIATMFIIAGIDKENIKIEKTLLLFGYICVSIYMLYLYIVENDTNIYRYVIYLIILCIVELYSIFFLRKKAKDSYTTDILLLSLLMILFTYETVYIYTVVVCLIIISLKMIFDNRKKNKVSNKVKFQNKPIGAYMCISNIFILLLTNFIIFYR